MNSTSTRRTPTFALLAALAVLPPGAAPSAGETTIAADRGASLVFQKLLKLQTTASVLHTHPHPDDEHGALLALLSRGLGARTSVLTMNRGEGGANAIGPEVFDALGLLRTEEQRVANRYYGVDHQYFTTTADYGFSKRLEEAREKWGDTVLRDVVRVVRMNRPFVLISRSAGNQKDGQGDPETDSLVTQEAFRLAGDPAAFPEQIAAGLRPFRPIKVYVGGQMPDGDWSVRVDTGVYAPWLGESFASLSRKGLAFQRSQNSGRVAPSRGPQPAYYKRVGSTVESTPREDGFFTGIDTTLPGLFKTLGSAAPPGVDDCLRRMDNAVSEAMSAYSIRDPTRTVPFLARGLRATRDALALLGPAEFEAAFILEIKETQFEAAITAALGVDLKAVAHPDGDAEPEPGSSRSLALPSTMGAPVPDQTFGVRVLLTNQSELEIVLREIAIEAAQGWTTTRTGPAPQARLERGQTAVQRFSITLASDVALSSRPHFARSSIRESRYAVRDPDQAHRPVSKAPAVALVRYSVEGVEVEIKECVRRLESRMPHGHEWRELRVVPRLALTADPDFALVPLSAPRKKIPVDIHLLSNAEEAVTGEIFLRLPNGWISTPATQPFKHARGGERSVHRFTVVAPKIEERNYEVQAVARAKGREYSEGYSIIEKRDLETRLAYRLATVNVLGIDINAPAGLNVGYVMGVGDQIPAALGQLGARVTLLSSDDLATASLSRFDAIMTGIRAYAVRGDLVTYNQRLLDYVKEGGNLIVLYNTQEFVPDRWAPYPARLPARAEEVSEEDSAIEILAHDAPVLNHPNKITERDFEGWVEQRGSKFFTEWDEAYTPIIATWDLGQAEQKGGWLQAKHGKGHYTYFAYALHRQLPNGVAGAYRLLANLLSLSRPSVRPAETLSGRSPAKP